MDRRTFFLGMGALGATAATPTFAREENQALANRASDARNLKITHIQFHRLRGHYQGTRRGGWQHQVQPLHIYPEHRPAPPQFRPSQENVTIHKNALYLTIQTNEGVEGIYGPIDSAAAVVVDRQLKRFLIGQNPLEGETLWDKMYRLNRHSRAGHFMMAISAVDNALWDLRGHFYGVPVYRLLGGPTRDRVEAYGSCLGYSIEPEAAHHQSAQFKKEGFRYQKWFLAYGPGDGTAGLKKNINLVKALRKAVGDEVELMFDAFMGWDLNYALDWAQVAEAYNPRWIEEAFPPNRIDSFADLKQKTSIPVATGEHFYNRWNVHKFLQADALNVVQADPEWCGGVSELVKICTLASVHDVHVAPHGHSLHAALHVVASQSPMTCPLVEYLIQKMDDYYFFETHQPKPVEGKIALPERPGFGIVLDESKIEKRENVSWS